MLTDAQPDDPVWVAVDEEVLPARVVRCYVRDDGQRVVVKWPQADLCPRDCFAVSVFAETDYDAARAYSRL